MHHQAGGRDLKEQWGGSKVTAVTFNRLGSPSWQFRLARQKIDTRPLSRSCRPTTTA